MVPIAPFGVFGYVWDGAQGMVALAYLIGMVAMFFTAMSYWSMSRAFPVSGSVYAYAQRGIHPIVGFFAGWLILLDYILVPSLLYIVSAAALGTLGGELRQAANLFDSVRYGEVVSTAVQDEWMRRLAQAIAQTRPLATQAVAS